MDGLALILFVTHKYYLWKSEFRQSTTAAVRPTLSFVRRKKCHSLNQHSVIWVILYHLVFRSVISEASGMDCALGVGRCRYRHPKYNTKLLKIRVKTWFKYFMTDDNSRNLTSNCQWYIKKKTDNTRCWFAKISLTFV